MDDAIKYKALNSMRILAIKHGLVKDVHEIDKVVQDRNYKSFVQYLNSKGTRN